MGGSLLGRHIAHRRRILAYQDGDQTRDNIVPLFHVCYFFFELFPDLLSYILTAYYPGCHGCLLPVSLPWLRE